MPLLNDSGVPIIGHGVIKPISLTVMDAQLSKRAQDYDDYRKKIENEFKMEQPALFRLLWDLAETHAFEWANVHEIEGSSSYDHCVDYWTERFMFILYFQYKLISLGIEAQWMEGTISL